MKNSLRQSASTPAILLLGAPLGFRITFGLVALFLIGVMVAGGRASPVALVLLALSLVGVVFVDEWAFDTAATEIRHRTGLLIAARTRRYPATDVEAVRLHRGPAGGFSARFYRVAVVMRSGDELSVEMDKTTDDSLAGHAQAIADHLGVPLVGR
ncbi:MAG: hypothetical protein EA382_05190 [Spirochaetaceae bacterium]|nr:MAG: hypothetical protein EA382_05190 [Spirochaetaceae bacterium]